MAAVDLCTLDDVKQAIDFSSARPVDDELIGSLITEASRRIMRRTRRELAPKTDNVARLFEVEASSTGRRPIVDLSPYDLRNADTVVLHPETASPVTLAEDVDYILRPVNGSDGTGTFTRLELGRDVSLTSDRSGRFGRALLSVTGDWGAWATAEVVEDVRRAAAETVVAWLDRPAAQYGLTLGEEARPGMGAPDTSWDIPSSAWRKLQPFERIVVA